jgi:hypothetical protein
MKTLSVQRPFTPQAPWLVFYGLFLFAVAVAAVMYDPKSGQLGFNASAKTALISGGICGGLSIVWGLLAGRGGRWPLGAALVSTVLFAAAFTWRATVGWAAFAAGTTEKWYAATLITTMAVASLLLIASLIRALFTRGGARPSMSVPKQRPV